MRPLRRHFLGLVVTAALVARSFAAAPSAANGYELKVTTDRADQVYRRGDTVIFTVALLRDGKPVAGPEAKWSITKDGVPLNREGTAAIPASGLGLTAQLDEPGFLHCMVECTPPGTPKLTARGGAAIEPLAIKPSQPVPADFDAFWAAQKKQLAATPANLRFTPIASPSPDIE